MAEILTRRDGAIATVVISNPAKHNAVTPDMWRALDEALAHLERDPAVRVIVLTGDGDKAFVSGADIAQLGNRRDASKGEDTQPVETRVPYMAPMKCAKPVIAKIRGICMGGGLGLAAACDIRFCSDDAVFRMPAARLGIGYSHVGVARYVSLIGAANTLDIFLSARKFGAADALRMGFVLRVLPPAELDREVQEYCATISENAPLSLLAVKRSVSEALKDPGERDIAAVQAIIDSCIDSEDYKEGRAAFMEKRRPAFKGR